MTGIVKITDKIWRMPVMMGPESGNVYDKNRPPPFFRRTRGAVVIEHLTPRCEQELTAVLSLGITGTWKTSAVLYVQPKVMKPAAVAMCECLVTALIPVPEDIVIVDVCYRGDAYAGEEPAFEKIQELVLVGAEPDPYWMTWYNVTASADEQEVFDAVTKVMDAGGLEYMQGGKHEGYINTFSDKPELYKALVSYRDTGGRRALITDRTKSYGDKPISVIRSGGPIEKDASGRVILHPGRYSYSDVLVVGDVETLPTFSSETVEAKSTPFRKWLDARTKERLVQPIATQATREKSFFLKYGETYIIDPTLGEPLYIDYEFLVATDVVWDTRIKGIPSWLPKNVDLTQYWGKPAEVSAPTLQDLKDAAKAAAEKIGGALSGIATLAVFGGIGYVLFLLARDRRREARA
jgi:hypothetical protein